VSVGRREITVWVCDECDYWRQEQSTGVHQTYIPADRATQKETGSRDVIHALRKARFVEVTA
jgi:hypothetical protein